MEEKGKTLFKEQIIDEVARELDIPTARAKRIIDHFLLKMAEGLAGGYKLVIKGLGTFFTQPREPRVGTNPQTHRRMEIGRTISIRFKPSSPLKRMVRGG